MRRTYDLNRFVSAQAACIQAVENELRAGFKRTHWMWFVFPQLAGLGSSGMAKRYAIASLEEAEAYLQHPLLGSRLAAHTQLVIDANKPVNDIFGFPDNLKFHSCITLFAEVPSAPPIFKGALDKLFEGRRDSRTLDLLKR